MIAGLARLSDDGQPIPRWMLGGGTALMLALEHRLSNDIDAFINDAQYLGFLDPEIGAENVWRSLASERQPHYLKLAFEEGEIDFIAGSPVTGLSPWSREIGDLSIEIAHPVEVAISKMHHRPRSLKVRDIFDIAAVDRVYATALSEQLRELVGVKSALNARLGEIVPSYYRAEMAEIDILDGWRDLPATALDRVTKIVAAIPDREFERS